MNSENQEVLYCVDDDEYRIYSELCDKSCIERYYKNHLKSVTHTNKLYKRQRINILNIVFNKVNVCVECY